MIKSRSLEENPKFIKLENIVDSSICKDVSNSEKLHQIQETCIRGKKIKFYTPNRRTLWQSFGQEFIESEQLNFIDQIKSNGIYFDVGAGTGNFALYAAVSGKNTFCFEPEVENFYMLNYNNYLNYQYTKNKFHGFNIAISNKKKIDEMYIKQYSPGSHEKILNQKESINIDRKVFDSEYCQNVISLSIDEFCLMANIQPTDIKIDVDGSELKVIQGMENTLTKQTLKRIFIEINEANKNSINSLQIILRSGFQIDKKYKVQHYENLNNYILLRS